MTGVLFVLGSAAALVVVLEIGAGVHRREMAGRCGPCEGSGRAFGIPDEDWCVVCTGTGRA